MDAGLAAPNPQRRFQRFDEAAALGGREPQAILNHFEHDALLIASRGSFRTLPFAFGLSRSAFCRLHAPREHARVALRLEQLQDLCFGEIVGHDERERDHEASVFPLHRLQSLTQVCVDRLRGVAAHGTSAGAAVKLRSSREEELQMIVELRHRADGRARGAHRVRLVDRDRGRNALDPLDARTIHAVEELSSVRRESLDIAPLTFGVERIEYERGFSGTGNTGHDNQLIRRQLDVDGFEIILARAANNDGFGHC